MNIKVLSIEKNLSETQLEFFYLTSPLEIEKKLINYDLKKFKPIEHSKIFYHLDDFTSMGKKLSNLRNKMKKKNKKNKQTNQTSFYFEDYLETNKRSKILKKSSNLEDRIYLLFFLFFSLIIIFFI